MIRRSPGHRGPHKHELRSLTVLARGRGLIKSPNAELNTYGSRYKSTYVYMLMSLQDAQDILRGHL